VPAARGVPDRRPLSERFRPRRLDDLVGNPRARFELRTWAERWQAGGVPTYRAAVLSGPPGVGKTSAATALATELGWSLVEMNASDARNESAIEEVAGRASVSHTLSDSGPGLPPARALILLDEADCLTGRLTETPKPVAKPTSLRDFLEGRYGSVDALNAAWGLGTAPKTKPFPTWEEVPRSPGRATWTHLPAARADLDEWKTGGSKPTDLSDRGGLGAITRLVQSTRQPILLTVNDDRSLTRYSMVFRNRVTRIRFYPIRDAEIAERLRTIVRGERYSLVDGAIEAIVRRAQGDLRAALNDLEAVAAIPAGPLQLSVLGTRDVTSDLALFAAEVLSSDRFYRSFEVRDRVDATPDDLLPWIEENVPRFAPDARHREEAFRTLAAAEAMLARARRWRVYGLWSYANELLSGGVSVTIRDAPAPIGSNAAFPQFLGDMGRSRNARALREALVAKVGTRFHLSHRKTRALVLPFLEGVFLAARGKRADPELRRSARAIARELELTPEEAAYLLEVDSESAVVRELLAPEVAPESGPTVGHGERGPGDSPDTAHRPAQRSLSDFGGG
jgi:DNA polymerase III delta prime subunit